MMHEHQRETDRTAAWVAVLLTTVAIIASVGFVLLIWWDSQHNMSRIWDVVEKFNQALGL